MSNPDEFILVPILSNVFSIPSLVGSAVDFARVKSAILVQLIGLSPTKFKAIKIIYVNNW